jgi:hypothetical protein
MRPASLPLLILLPFALAWQPAANARDIHEVADAHPRGEVEISNIAGRIEVLGWDEERVEVTGTLGRGVERLEFRTQGRHTLIRVDHGSNKRNVGPSELRVRSSGREPPDRRERIRGHPRSRGVRRAAHAVGQRGHRLPGVRRGRAAQDGQR